MKKNINICLGIITVTSIAVISHSIVVAAGLTLLLSGTACYIWDLNSKSKQIRAVAFHRNSYLVTSGIALCLLSFLCLGTGNGQSPDGLRDFLWVVLYSFSLTAAPALLWLHFAKRRFTMEKAKLYCHPRNRHEQTVPFKFENQYSVSDTPFYVRKTKTGTTVKQYRLAV